MKYKIKIDKETINSYQTQALLELIIDALTEKGFLTFDESKVPASIKKHFEVSN